MTIGYGKTGLPVYSAILKPIIKYSKFLKGLPPLQKQPYIVSIGASDIDKD
jgi:hypothetical protein